MHFTEAVMGKVDESKAITPEQYAALPEKEHVYWTADYKKYRAKKVRRYEDCDLGHTHYMGWEEIQVPIGEPYRYLPAHPILPHVLDRLLSSTVIAERIMGRVGVSDKKTTFKGMDTLEVNPKSHNYMAAE